MGAVQAKHRLEVLYEKLFRRFEAPFPPAQMPGREEGREETEEQEQRKASQQMGPPAPGGCNEGCRTDELLEKEGDGIREYRAMHEENFLSKWPREDVEGKEEGKKKVHRETKEEVSRKREREGKKGEDQTVVVKRRCINPVSAEAIDIFSQEEDLESCGNSWGDLSGDSCGLVGCACLCLMCLCLPLPRWLS